MTTDDKPSSTLFEVMRRFGLRPGKAWSTITKWKRDRIQQFTLAAIQATYAGFDGAKSGEVYLANSQLSGAPRPCAQIQCRIRHADELARFASLYADRTLVLDPFEGYQLGALPRDNFGLDRDKARLANDVEVVFHLKPLIETGLVGFYRDVHVFCGECMEKVKEQDTKWSRIENQIVSLLYDEYLSRVTFEVAEEDDPAGCRVDVTGPAELVEHPLVLLLSPKIAPPFKKLLKKTKTGKAKLSRAQVKRFGLAQKLSNWIVEDLYRQSFHFDQMGTRYVSDRPIDFDLIALTNDRETNTKSRMLIDGFAHTVPYLGGVAISKLVRLRQEEGEAFRVYRDALNAGLAAAKVSKSPAEVFDDVVRPELHKVEHAVKNSRKLIRDSIRQDVIFGAAAVAIGLFMGVIPHNIGEVLALVGGLHSAGKVVGQANSLSLDPKEARDSKFYFLWRAMKVAASNRRSRR